MGVGIYGSTDGTLTKRTATGKCAASDKSVKRRPPQAGAPRAGIFNIKPSVRDVQLLRHCFLCLN